MSPEDTTDRDEAAPDDAASDAVSDDASDGAWFDALFAAHATAVYRYLVRRLPAGAADAEDLAADVLATAWRRRADVPRGAELPWLYRTAGYVLANHRRKARAPPVAVVPEVPDDMDPATLAVDDDRVRAVLGRLSARDRRILLLVAWDGLDGGGLAQVLEVSRGGADAALSRARARLRAAWDAEAEGLGASSGGGFSGPAQADAG